MLLVALVLALTAGVLAALDRSVPLVTLTVAVIITILAMAGMF
ncbi:hypothetical protein [Microbispora sp. KK1-11]|nr:hypothetical protein [Microbispora sp. KK1-11]